MSPADYRSLAVKAMNDALEYRIEAITANEVRQQTLVKWAAHREADAAFYASRADIHEEYAERHAPQQEKAA
jgi:hypothetical protein